MENGTVALRDRIDGDLGSMTIEEAIQKLSHEKESRQVRQVFHGSAGLGNAAQKSDDY